MAALNISDLLNALSTSHGDKFVRGEVSTWLGAAPAKAAKKSKPKAAAATVDPASDGDAPAAKGAVKSAWTAFVKQVCGPPRAPTAEYAAWLEEHPEHEGKGHTVGPRAKYASAMKGDDDANYEAFKAEFKSSSSASASSADGGAAPAEKPKRKPGRPKKATASAAAGAGGGVEFSLSDSESEEEEKPKPKPKPKQMAKMAPGAPKKAPKPSALPPLPLSDSEDDDIAKIDLFGEPFYWDADTNILYAVNAEGRRGEIIGSYDGHSASFT